MEAINQSVPLAVEFSDAAAAVAAHDSFDAARGLYEHFGKILQRYEPPRGFSGTFKVFDFDFPKFIGQELFATLIAMLLRNDRLELVAELLEQDLYVQTRATAQSS